MNEAQKKYQQWGAVDGIEKNILQDECAKS